MFLSLSWLIGLTFANIDGDVLVYQPLLMPSHATFMARLVDVLADTNYSVVVLVNRHREDFPHGCDKAKEIIEIPPVEGVLNGLSPKMGWMVKETPASQWEAMNYLTIAHGKQCKALLNDDVTLNILRGRKFRFLLHEVFDMCGLALKEILNIEHQIIVSSTRQMDTVGYEIGLTNPFLHAGILSDYGSTFGWLDVFRNAWFIDSFLKFTNNQVEMYKDEAQKWNLPYPLRKVSQSASAVFLNTHPITDSWRSSLRNVYDIGGIALHEPKPLSSEMSSQISNWKHIVLVSFGTVVPSAYMPEKWKNNLIAVIESLPEVLFLWKYEIKDEISAKNMPNVILSSFFPQNDLLQSGSVSLFITHGGQNSILEAAKAGVKLVVIPQFGDQFRNAQAVKERNLGIVLTKENLGDFGIMKNAIETALQEKRVHRNVSHLISTELAVTTFITKLEESLQTGLTFKNGPELWNTLRIIDVMWNIVCIQAATLLVVVSLRLYPLWRLVIMNVRQLITHKDIADTKE